MTPMYELPLVAIRLVKERSFLSDTPISTPQKAVDCFREYLSDMDRELICVINIGSDCIPISGNIVSVGSLTYSIVELREVYKSAILSNASHIILLHNHPGGTLKPSSSDIAVTDRCIRCGELLGIPLIDHIILAPGTDSYFSFQEKGLINSGSVLSYASSLEDLVFTDREVTLDKKAVS